MINWLRHWQKSGQPIRNDGPETHLFKKGTPTMGGIIILLGLLVSVLMWSDISNPFIQISIASALSMGTLGFVDDYLKVSKYNTKGVSGRIKLLCQFSTGAVLTYFSFINTQHSMADILTVPFFKNFIIHLGFFYIVFGAIVITGSSNSVNLTDGLDGLVSGPLILAFSCYGIITYIVGHTMFSEYLQVQHINGVGELSIVCAAAAGSLLGFLWYNAPPAQIFMGDVGSLALGGLLGSVAVMSKHEILLAIIGGLFVIEALSVMLQVFWFKFKGRRIFLMAPVHHHFEKLGWSESKVVVRFWIIAILFAMVGLSTLKLR